MVGVSSAALHFSELVTQSLCLPIRGSDHSAPGPSRTRFIKASIMSGSAS